MYKGIRKRKKEKLHDISCFKVDVKIFSCPEFIAYNKLAIFLCQKLMTYNNSIVVMGGVS
jgi:hypothetical protein